MQKVMKYIVPLVGIMYCIAFFEVQVDATQHQTFNDGYDTYTYSISQDLNFTQFVQHEFKLDFGNLDFLVWHQSEVLSNSSEVFSKKPLIPVSNKIFINNCTWLI